MNVNDQVVHRVPLQNNVAQIRVGTILAFKDEGRIAVVSFPTQSTRAEIPVERLESAQKRFGRAVVQLNPVRRNLFSGR